MQKYYPVSLIKNGILGGGMVIESEAIVYRTGKLTVPAEYRNLVMNYDEISHVTPGWFLILPTVTIHMRNGAAYQFAMFFSRKKFIDKLKRSDADA